MAEMDVFKGDAFSMLSLLAAIENVDYKEQFLGTLGLFSDMPQRTRTVAIESRDSELSIIQTSPIGAPLAQRSNDKRKFRNFNTVRLAKQSKVMADEIQGIRAFGSESELQAVQDVVARKLALLVNDMELTWEYHRLGAVQGKVLDADGDELVNYFDEFGVSEPSVVPFPFVTLTAGDLRPLIEGSITRPIIRAAKGAFNPSSLIYGLCGDDFWDLFVNHVEVRGTYLNQAAAAALREPTAFNSFNYAGVIWVNYRGTDDGSTVAIGSDEVKFFPVNAPGIFQVAWAPAEFMPTANQLGVPILPMTVPDPSGRQAFVDVEVYSYPLFLCTRPLTLRSGVVTT